MRAALIALATFLSVATLARAQETQVTAHPDDKDPVIVDGSFVGPKLWRVFDDDSEVYILGTVDPLGKDLKWKSRQLDAVSKLADRGLTAEPKVSVDVLQIAKLVFTAGGDVIKNPDGAKLSSLVDPPTMARYRALLARYKMKEKDLEKYRPYIAGSALLNRALEDVKLERARGIEDDALRDLRRRGKPVTAITRVKAKPLIKAMENLRPGADLPCFRAQLTAIESYIPTLKTRADAWARGEVATIRATPDTDTETICYSALQAGGVPIETLRAQALEDWAAAVEQNLETPGVTLAVGPMDLFIAKGAVLDRMRAKGYEVTGP
jgi:uncharacterized protein YbaP (TraB family)